MTNTGKPAEVDEIEHLGLYGLIIDCRRRSMFSICPAEDVEQAIRSVVILAKVCQREEVTPQQVRTVAFFGPCASAESFAIADWFATDLAQRGVTQLDPRTALADVLETKR